MKKAIFFLLLGFLLSPASIFISCNKSNPANKVSKAWYKPPQGKWEARQVVVGLKATIYLPGNGNIFKINGESIVLFSNSAVVDSFACIMQDDPDYNHYTFTRLPTPSTIYQVHVSNTGDSITVMANDGKPTIGIYQRM